MVYVISGIPKLSHTIDTSSIDSDFYSFYFSSSSLHTFLPKQFNYSAGKESNKQKKMGNNTDIYGVAHCILSPSYTTQCPVFSIPSVPWQIICILKTCIAAQTPDPIMVSCPLTKENFTVVLCLLTEIQ